MKHHWNQFVILELPMPPSSDTALLAVDVRTGYRVRAPSCGLWALRTDLQVQ
jgi:hypothetical protein